MTVSEKKQLQITACKVRMGVIESTYGAKAGHPGGSLSAAEVFTYLYTLEALIYPIVRVSQSFVIHERLLYAQFGVLHLMNALGTHLC